MKTRKHIIRTKNYRVEVQRSYSSLELLKAKNDAKAFYAVFINAIPDLRQYVSIQLKKLESNGSLPSKFYKADDLIDDLFLEVYNNFESITNEDEFYIFLFRHLNGLLDQYVASENKQHESVDRLDSYEKSERDKMLEKITAQFDGDIILEEELDDISYHSNQPEFYDVFAFEAEDKIEASEAVQTWTSEQIDELIDQLPLGDRNIGLLYVYFHLSIPEIVLVTKKSKKEVKRVIADIKAILKEHLF